MRPLLTSWHCQNERHLVVGVSNASALRIRAIRDAGATAVLCTNGVRQLELPLSLSTLIEEDPEIEVDYATFSLAMVTSGGRAEVMGVFDKVFVSLPIAQYDLKRSIHGVCVRNRIPINVSDTPELCTFAMLSTYHDGDFQLGVTTNGKGCKLASRIKRELAASLPPHIGQICDNVGELRKKIQAQDQLQPQYVGDDDDDAVNTSRLNELVEEFSMTQEQRKLQRTKWLSQIVEYYPLSVLRDVSIDALTHEYAHAVAKNVLDTTNHTTAASSRKGSISLVGAGPGSVSLLTVGAIEEIFSADLILADKLVPQQVLDLIPKQRTNLFIAKKFPGNAERAQEELLSLGLEALKRGEKVVRLKQGDPYIFGRGGEEHLFFAAHGFTPRTIPGITLALAAPVMSDIPATHRDVADQVLICTGTGRRGALPNLPEYIGSRTTVFLMALHRIVDLIPKLIEDKQWNPQLPVAVVERASCPDQRIIRTTLENVAAAVEANGSRPPGLLVTGYACEVIKKAAHDEAKWTVEEGCHNETSFDPIISLLNRDDVHIPVAQTE
jgi:uroporphyrin-III C-methyltransferase